jgi:dTDP-4-amino-4,6-dideoxygalactose transaminase
VPAFTFIATASTIVYAQGIPVFCDVDQEDFTINTHKWQDIEAVAPVHLFGMPCDMDSIMDFADDRNLKIIWDAAQAHGSRFNAFDVGAYDDMVCYSFYPSKNMTTGEGGMITLNNKELYEKLKLLRSHGQEKKYHHPSLGLNYRMTDVEAALGLKQLEKLDKFVEARRKNAKYLSANLNKVDNIISTPVEYGNRKHSYNQYSILVENRDQLAIWLKAKGIGYGIHYPMPLHKQQAFGLRSDDELPISEQLSREIISLPVHPYLDKAELKTIVEVIKEFYES